MKEINTTWPQGRTPWKVQDFDSPAEMLAYAETRSLQFGLLSSRRDGPGGTGGVDWNGTVALVRRGWPEGAARVRKLADALYERIKPTAPTWMQAAHDVTGAFVDVGVYVTGQPECMMQFVETEAPNPKPVNLVVSCSCSGGTGGDVIVNRGAAILAAAEALEQRGCCVSIDVENTTTRDGLYLTLRTRLKRPGEPMDTDALAFALMHPAFLRRLVWAAKESLEDRWARVWALDGCYGAPTDYPADHCEDGTIYFGPVRFDNRYRFATQESAVQVALEIMGRAGVRVDADA